MAETWAALLGRLWRAYAAAGLDCGDGLRPPARDAAIRNLARRLGIPIPPSLRAVWRVHGGQRYISVGVTGLFGKHRLHYQPPQPAGARGGATGDAGSRAGTGAELQLPASDGLTSR